MIELEDNKDFEELTKIRFNGNLNESFRWLIEQANEYQYVKSLFFDKLQGIEDKLEGISSNINSLSNKQTEENVSNKTQRLGRRIEEKKEDK